MVIETQEPITFLDENGEEADPGRPVRPPNFMGSSVRIVGPQESPRPREDSHSRVARGELGKIVQNYYFNRFLKDPLNRMMHATANASEAAILNAVIARSARRGTVNPEKTEVDPVAMTKHIKRVGKFFGAGAVGIARTLPEYVNEGGARTESENIITDESSGPTADEIAEKYPYTICFVYPWDYEMTQAHRHWIGDATYHWSGQKAGIVQNNLAGYVRELGYEVRQGGANSLPMMLAAGLGELGRNGIVIAGKFGPRIMPQTFLTNLPLIPDKPVDYGVSDFCSICRKCAVSCPTNSISFDKEKKVVNGVEKYQINWKTCYSLRPHTLNLWHNCLTCVASCPYTKPDVWWRRMTMRTLTTTPKLLRPLLVRSLIVLDDKIWGKLPRKRVQWIGLDSGQKIHEVNCTIAGCSCGSNPEPAATGQYPPFKENARRFFNKN